MKPLLLIQRILCTFAIIAVLLGPAAVATAAAAMASSGSMSGMSMGMDQPQVDEQTMADMDCCPEASKPAIPDCMKSCPLALVCTSVIVGSLSSVHDVTVVYFVPMSFLMRQETDLASAVVEPLPRPPSA
ncbi:hypothetical protein G6M64_09000 [Agrobacterium tumefaciens]|uniref:hypothetical protein n=1 Tax=Agrobacterium tumefaciens TaxID=358 RepID=UPI001573B5A4|nr:hypothetical protein [Agrobacterium tumefaciens]NSZ03274.1 hypothetical protein [Agrobacterium tumefaciens]NSZ36668.1 hypothetical protein [Agrobacterium tumefaciens]NTA84774.1 hypothetical protein [Agrobacterium tumefaciens]NTB24724.1 hypothetical protein [Agrobacterium tumefaciens]NTB27530.1 hypothetical protein [Agrobacterium tumefaciens]